MSTLATYRPASGRDPREEDGRGDAAGGEEGAAEVGERHAQGGGEQEDPGRRQGDFEVYMGKHRTKRYPTYVYGILYIVFIGHNSILCMIYVV